MGHLTGGKDIFQKLGQKIDGLGARVAFNDTFYEILRELYTPREAEVIARMPYGLSVLEDISRSTGVEPSELRGILEGLCNKGLVLDLFVEDKYHYAPSPMVIGIFEFTMMRTGEGTDSKKWAKLFDRYMNDSDDFYAANFGHGEELSVMRTLPHEETLAEEAHLEILDYERAESIVRGSEKFSLGICSCRHEKHHNGTKSCDTPLEMCTSFGYAADYMVRNGLAREASRQEILDNLAEARDRGLVLNADNVQRNLTYMCLCCKCCCNALAGISRHGYANSIVTSNYIAEANDETCTGCGRCAKVCAIDCIEMVADDSDSKRKRRPVIDRQLCLGCGVCALKCPASSMKLERRDKQVIVPATTFHKVLLAALERGTLQNQLFSDPRSITQKFLRGFVGGFLRLAPVKKALLSRAVRSRFLAAMEKGVRRQGKGWLAEM